MRDDDWTDGDEGSGRPSRATVWMQRGAGIVLGAMAGTAAAFSPDIWHALGTGTAAAGDRVAADQAEVGIAPDPAEMARQMATALLARSRDLMARGEIREAERFIAAAAQLEPHSASLAETRRLLEVAKAKIELAKKAPATGKPQLEAAVPERQGAKPPADGAPDRSASTSASPSAHFAEGVKHFRARNYNAALAAFGLAAAAGHAPAQNYLGYMYRHGFGVGQDYAKALFWYHKAAAQNHGGALNNIGYMYRHGLGVERDLAQARDWFRRAAERGDAAGQYNLAQMHADGMGAAPDYAQALKWYRAAADQGHPRAAMGIAHLYAQGLGIQADPGQAYFWYGVAARAGVEGAQRFRTAMGAQLTAAQRQQADARLAGWKSQSAEGEGQ